MPIQNAQLTIELLQAYGVEDSGTWVNRAAILDGGKWAVRNRERVLAAFPKCAVGKVATSELANVRDAATFLRQFLRWNGDALFFARKSDGEGGLERKYARAGAAPSV